MSPCIDPAGDWPLLVQADHDRELDAAEAARVAGHLRACPHCADWARDLAVLSAAIAEQPRETAPPTLRRAVIFRPARRRALPMAGLAAAAALAASLLLTLLPAAPDGAEGLVASHIRALQPGHLIDVASSDRHTVRPWFAGRLDYAPPVRDLSAAGFTLLGGRQDYLDDRPVAALVYRRARHDIDLFIWPGTATRTPVLTSLRGYNLVRWSGDGMQMRAVSDLDGAELLALAQAWAAAPDVGEPAQ